MTKTFLVLSLSFLTLFSNSTMLAQRSKRDDTQKNRSSASSDSSPIPLVHGRKNDGLPDNLRVRGTITGLSFARAYCGDIAWAGTLKIKLFNRIDGYPREDVFVVVTCFLDPGNENKYLNKVVSLDLAKLYGKKDGPCYFDIATNTIDSKGAAFYCTALGQDQILKVIEKENAQ